VGSFSTVAGGADLALNASSFGFNADTSGTQTSLNSATFNNTAYFGNVDLWLGNVDGTPRQLKFFAPNLGGYNYATATYSSFAASSGQIGTINYTWPPAQGTASTVLTNNGSGTLSWASAAAGAWLLTGNATTGSGEFLGTTTMQSLELKVNNIRGMLYQWNGVETNLVGGDPSNTANSSIGATIGGGGGSGVNKNSVTDNYGTIAGGRMNLAGDNAGTASDAPSATVAGGENNRAQGGYSSIGGGATNQTSGMYSAIGGGVNNWITGPSQGSAIFGGEGNNILHDPLSTDALVDNFIGGGYQNNVLDDNYSGGIGTGDSPSQYSAIVGGYQNQVSESFSFVGAGELNFALDDHTSVVGGAHNKANNSFASVGGGSYNLSAGTAAGILNGMHNGISFGAYSSIGGGGYNVISANYSFIGSGGDVGTPSMGNIINVGADYSAILGGHANVLSAEHAVIGGGSYNKILAAFSGILGGTGNVIDYLAGGGNPSFHGHHNAIVGGESNKIDAPTRVTYDLSHNFIGGGEGNEILSAIIDDASNTDHAVIVGGMNNTVFEPESFVGGGIDNHAIEDQTVVCGGESNSSTEHWAAVCGGLKNIINARSGFIGGGTNNLIDVLAENANIPGGKYLAAQGYMQTVVGQFNEKKGNWDGTPGMYVYNLSITPKDIPNQPAFIIGNGTNDANRFNTFEVSYNGHSTVTHTNGGIGGQVVIKGASYTDNIVRAWGEIDATGIIISSFGIHGPAVGWFGNKATVWLDNAVDPDANAYLLTNGSVTATIQSTSDNTDPGCATIAVSPIKQGLLGGVLTNYFVVWTHNLVSGTCSSTPLQFTFKVCGR
jgi:hypothetical protein